VVNAVHLAWSGACLYLVEASDRPILSVGAYGIGTVTVVRGVDAVRPIGVVTVAEMTGVLTVTVAATVAGDVGTGSVGREPVCNGSVEGNSDRTTSAVDERTDGGVASPLEPGADAGAALTSEPSVVFD
jgi:hypothetical protein